MIHSTMGGMHLVSALAAILLIVAGALATVLGLAYSFAMLMTCTSALLLYGMTGHFGLFHFFAVLSLTNVVMGVTQAILRRGDWMRRHLIWMGWSYLVLLAGKACGKLADAHIVIATVVEMVHMATLVHDDVIAG